MVVYNLLIMCSTRLLLGMCFRSKYDLLCRSGMTTKKRTVRFPRNKLTARAISLLGLMQELVQSPAVFLLRRALVCGSDPQFVSGCQWNFHTNREEETTCLKVRQRSLFFYSVDFVVEGFDVFLSGVLVVVSFGHSLSDLHGGVLRFFGRIRGQYVCIYQWLNLFECLSIWNGSSSR